jgi:hypothetical protein
LRFAVLDVLGGGLEAAAGGDDGLGLCVGDADGELPRREASKDDAVDGADPAASEHRDQGLGNHGHVNDHPVPLADAEGGEAVGEARHLVTELPVGDLLHKVQEGAVVNERGLVTAAVRDMAVKHVVRHGKLSISEPRTVLCGTAQGTKETKSTFFLSHEKTQHNKTKWKL